jgi:hypothetical protein
VARRLRLVIVRFVIRRLAILAAAALAVASWGSVAHADEDLPHFSVDGVVAWVNRPPPASIYTPGKGGVPVEGLPYDWVTRSGTMTAVGLRLSMMTTQKPFVFPLFSLSLALGGGGYVSHAAYQGATLDRSDPLFFGQIGLPGVGLMSQEPGWLASVALVPGVDFFGWNGNLSAPPVQFSVQGDAVAFVLRAEARVCAKVDRWWCAAGGPNLLEGETWFNGATLSVGTSF